LFTRNTNIKDINQR